ncbi:MAG: thiamine diphosphokinase [Patescibacteria group bacterium]
MKRVVIFVNGNLSDLGQAKKIIIKTDYLIAADGGANLFKKLGLTPNIVIGDMDSIKPKLLKKYKSINYPRKKDKTDFELAIDYCFKNKFQEIIIFGILGDRIDHMMANIFLIAKIQSENKLIKIKIIEGNKEIFVLNKEIIIEGKIGDEISIIPISDKLEKITTEGLEYQLKNDYLLFGSTKGVSNVMNKTKSKITASAGIAVIEHNSQ